MADTKAAKRRKYTQEEAACQLRRGQQYQPPLPLLPESSSTNSAGDLENRGGEGGGAGGNDEGRVKEGGVDAGGAQALAGANQRDQRAPPEERSDPASRHQRGELR